MGNCVAVRRSSQHPMKLQLSVKSNKAENDLVGSHLIEDVRSNGNLVLEQIYSSQFASNRTEEVYFDSIPWVESDSDDFYSVSGDLTPSRGNSPVYQSSSLGSTQLERTIKDVSSNAVSECSPIGTKKLLIELFRESFNNNSREADSSLQVKAEFKSDPLPFSHISLGKSPCYQSDNCSESSRGTSLTGESYVIVKSRSKPCCIPVIARSLSFSETKKKLCFSGTNGG